MKIYTKNGDQGVTCLIGGKRVPKNDKNLKATGDIDELNSWIGLLKYKNNENNYAIFLHEIQTCLFQIGAITSCINNNERKKQTQITEKDVIRLENSIDLMNEKLPEIKNFIYPYGPEEISFINISRSICRRCERSIMDINYSDLNDIIKYLNRLSDWLFVYSRYRGFELGIDEEKWLTFK